MEWTPGDISKDIEDRRDQSSGGGGGFGGFGMPHLGIGGIIVVGVLSLLFHRNFFALFSGGSSATYTAQPRTAPDRRLDDSQRREMQLMSFVLDDVQKTWTTLLPDQAHVDYRHAKLVTFRDATSSPCGMAGEATGPFYCPGDEKVYLDLGFFDELKSRFGGSNAEFAQAYVLAHELGHHVQKILGIEAKVRRLQERNSSQANRLSVDLELQADCLAGVWGHSASQRKILDPGDVEAAMSAAAAVGDDRIQKAATGTVSPEKFTHGTASQRTTWLQRGLDSGNISSCNTFRTQE